MVSVIIPAYNEEKYLGDCLEALVRQVTTHDYEVVVVDNASTDRTAEVARSFSDRLNLRVISEKRKGRGQARATGFSEAKGDVLLGTDADTQVPPDWVERMVQPFQNPHIAGTTCSGAIGDLGRVESWLYRVGDVLYMLSYRLFFGYNTVVGFGLGVRKKAYDQCGGFDRHLKAQEDVEFARRLRRCGPIVYLPSLWVRVSGRRFKKGIVPGLFQYLRTTIEFFIFKKKTIDLDDVR